MVKILLGLALLLGLMVGLRWTQPYAFEHDRNLLTGNTYEPMTAEQIDDKLTAAEKNKELTMVVFHKSGCKKCRSVERFVHNQVSNTKMNVIVVDTKMTDQRKYVSDFGIHSVPTFVVLQQGEEVTRYSGTNETEIARVFDTKGE